MSLRDELQAKLAEDEDWVFRRQKGIPNDRRLFVLACMDERLPVEEALGLGPGDAHVFRNAGGFVTDDAIRSAALTIHFFGTREIVIVNHTECGMLSATGEEVSSAIEEKAGVDLTRVALDPALEDFRLARDRLPRWWKMQTDIDLASQRQVEAFERHPLIPDDVVVSSYVYEVESGKLRRPREIQAVKTAILVEDR
jgi:carbonic anhydrase